MEQRINELCTQLHDEMQAVKRWYLACPDRLDYPDCGLGSDQNGTTTRILDAHGAYARFRQCCADLRAASSTLPESDRYTLLREMLVVHPSLHELWYFDGHYNHLTGNGAPGLRDRRFTMAFNRGGLNAYLTTSSTGISEATIGRIGGYARRALGYTALLENLYAGRLGVSLFEVEPLAVAELPEAIAALSSLSDPAPDDVLDRMPTVFGVTRGLLALVEERDTRARPTTTADLLNGLFEKVADTSWAMCAINEGPIFDRRSSRTGLEVLREIKTLEMGKIREVLREHYDVITDGFPADDDVLPRAAGRTPAPARPRAQPVRSSGAGGAMTQRDAFLERLHAADPGLVPVAVSLLDWGERHELAEYWGGTVVPTSIPYIRQDGSTYQFVQIRSNGRFNIDLKYIRKYPQFRDEAVRDSLIDRLAKIPGLEITREAFLTGKRPGYPMELLLDPQVRDKFVETLDFFVRVIRENPRAE